MDKININNLKIFAHHGVLAEEKGMANTFLYPLHYLSIPIRLV